MWKGFKGVPRGDPTFWTKPLLWKFMGLGECMSRLGESKAIFLRMKMNSTSCSSTRRVEDRTCSSDKGELEELFIQLGESEEDSFDVHYEGKLVESSPNSTRRNGYKDKWKERDSASCRANSASQGN